MSPLTSFPICLIYNYKASKIVNVLCRVGKPEGKLVNKVRVCHTGFIFISFDLCISEKLELGKDKNSIVHFNYHYYFTSLLALLMVNCSII